MKDGICDSKGIVHPKMKILSVFTNPHVVPNLYDLVSSEEHKTRYFVKCLRYKNIFLYLTNLHIFR